MDHAARGQVLEPGILNTPSNKPGAARQFDVVCLGRAAVDLYGHQVGGRLEDMQSFAKYLGGSSGNLAAGLARLDCKSSMLTRVGDEQMGRFVREALQREGVDTSHVVTDPERLTALVILGIADRNSFPHIFYRENCADMAVSKDDFDEAYIASSRALAITGTHVSTEGAYAAVRQAIDFAKANQTRVVLDIDYRPVLWGLVSAGSGEERFVESTAASQRIQSLLPDIDLLVGTEEEIRIAGGVAASGDDGVLAALRAIRKQSQAVIVLKRGPLGCSIFDGAIPDSLDAGITVAGVKVEVLNVLGAGDAFLSGFLAAWLQGQDWQTCARHGNACGALVVSRHGCTPAMPSRIELDDYLQRASSIPRPDLDARLDRLHRASNRPAVSPEMYILAFDHRRQLEDLAVSHVSPAPQISRFKSLVCDAVQKVAKGIDTPERLGIIVDDRYGSAVLNRMSQERWWIGRPAEIPASCPLELDPENNFGLPLLTWPAAHVVKCLVFYHPDDELELRLLQERRVKQLHQDCVRLDRELLLEVIVTSKGQHCDDATVARAMTRFYNLGIHPSWWKLESQTAAAWENISAVIARYDELCRGV
ncbi:MAG TPA: 5-dehydro-2-deoxygluconokinase, partial [Xanthomonadales bacterium]|nr:5-dehydro-2-deoxygluconokinase [Xanthomonadales bacterium]